MANDKITMLKLKRMLQLMDAGRSMNQICAELHMSKRTVSKGDTVTKGQKLGEVGSTGYSTATHLHFEIIINGGYVNPLNYFTLS